MGPSSFLIWVLSAVDYCFLVLFPLSTVVTSGEKLLPVRFVGKAYASSSLEGHEPSQAFELMPWTNVGKEKFPHIVWYKFPHRVKVAKFAFSSGVWGGLGQSPTQFALVGSNNCKNWKTIQRYKTKFTKKT